MKGRPRLSCVLVGVTFKSSYQASNVTCSFLFFIPMNSQERKCHTVWIDGTIKWIIIRISFQLTLGCLLKIPRLYREETLSSELHIGESYSHISWPSPLPMWKLSVRAGGFSVRWHKSSYGIQDDRKSFIQQFGHTRVFELSIKHWLRRLISQSQDRNAHTRHILLPPFLQLTWSSNKPERTQSLVVQN